MFSKVSLLYVIDDIQELPQFENKFTFLIEEIENIGYSVHKTHVLNDHANIVTNIYDAITTRDIVITIGNIAAVYQASGEVYNEPLSSTFTKCATCCGQAPQNSKILSDPNSNYKIIYMHKLFIINEHLKISRTSFNPLFAYLDRLRRKPEFTKVFKMALNPSIETYLKKEMEKQTNGLCINLDESEDGYMVRVRSDKLKELNQVQAKLFQMFGKEILESFFVDRLHNDLFESNDPNLQTAIQCIESCFNKYGPDNVFMSFNGGKDCTVLLHLMLAVLKKNYPNYHKPILCLYVKSRNPFQEVDDFIETVQVYYNLELVTIVSDIKDALSQILSQKPNLKACLMGTRRTDPFSQNLEPFKMTDNGWPKVMRVCPLLDWGYGNIWDYILDYKVPYCSLYDLGYTSLGNVNNTVPNSDLCVHNKEKNYDYYLPAYKLLNGSKERTGRN